MLRNFLLFMPAGNHDSKLRAVLSYYDSVVSVTPEGDSLVSDETLEGLGMDESSSSLFYSALYSLFGSLIRVASPPSQVSRDPSPEQASTIPSVGGPRDEGEEGSSATPAASGDAMSATHTDGDHESIDKAAAQRRRSVAKVETQQAGDETSITPSSASKSTPSSKSPETATTEPPETSSPHSAKAAVTKKEFTLTDFAPDPGYFLAGAIAGGVSRTATAPLDRLKVYLLVNTATSGETAVAAIKQGRPVAAVKNAFRPIGNAVKELFLNGGVKSFFAGKFLSNKVKQKVFTVLIRFLSRQWAECNKNYARDGHQIRVI